MTYTRHLFKQGYRASGWSIWSLVCDAVHIMARVRDALHLSYMRQMY